MNRRVRLGLAAGALALLPSMSAAEGTSCDTATYVVADGRVIESTIPAGATFFLYTNLTTLNRSYSLEIANVVDFWTVSPAGVFNAWSDVGGCVVNLVHRDTATSIEPYRWSPAGRRISWTHTTGGGGAEFSFQNTNAFPVRYRFSISETTLFSPTWSTNGGYETYWSFYNNTNAVINVSLRLTTTAGVSAGMTNIAVPAGRTSATNTVALGTGENLSGTAMLSHDGPPGSILIEADVANFALSPPYIQPVKFEAMHQTP